MTDADMRLLDEKVAELGEHFDSVQVFVTRHSGAGDETETYDVGSGNLYARLGQVAEWLEMQREYQRVAAAEVAREEGEDGI